MSDQSAQTVPASDLDATVDGLLAGPDASASVSAAVFVVPAPAPIAHSNGAARADLDDALAEGPMLAEVASDIERASPAPVVSQASPAAPSPRPAAPDAAVERATAADIERLDAAIATDADRLLAEAQADLPPEALQAATPAPVAAPARPIAPAVAPKPAPAAAVAQPAAPLHAPAPVAHAPPARSVEVIVEDRPRVVADAPAGPGVLVALAAPLGAMLRPIVELHERLGESTRQTVGYCAILTMFCAACAWGMPRFMRAKELEPVSQGQMLYDDTMPAHGTVAPVRTEPAAAAKSEHGGEGGEGHGEAKKPSRAKPEKKGAHGDGHGGGGDAHAEKKPSSRAKKPAKADEHAAHAEH